MKKNNFGKALCALAMGLFCLNSSGQTESENLKKYWNYRVKFQKHFTKIGRYPGNSICFANIDNVPGNSENGWANTQSMTGSGAIHGYKKTGDAMNMQGDYIAVLATQYKLLKEAGKDVVPTLNELYYAINTVNRVDLQAEPFFDPTGSLPVLNGFTIRDDVPKNLAADWNNESANTEDLRDMYEGISSDYYNDSDPNAHFLINEMSQDQSIGLMMGFVFVKKFVGHIYVKPTANDVGFYLDDEVYNITKRFMDHITQIWSIDNQTTELLEFDANLFNTINSYFGNPANTNTITGVCDLQDNWILVNPITGKKVVSESEMRPWSYAIAKTADRLTNNNFNYVSGELKHLGVDNLLDGNLCVTPAPFLIPLDGSAAHPGVNNSFWDPLQNASWSTAGVLSLHIPVPFTQNPLTGTQKYITWNLINQPEYNVNLSLTLATLSNTWSHNNVSRIADNWHMEIFDLMYSVLNNSTPIHSKAFWDNVFYTAPCEGPYHFRDANLNHTYPIVWNTSNLWNGDRDVTDNFVFGEFNGNDYMLAYNLYRIAFADQLNEDEYTDISCPCENSPKLQANTNVSAQTLVNNTVVKRKFANDYLPIGIKLKEFSINNLQIPSSKQLDVQTDLVVCNNSTMKIKNGGKIVVGDAASPQSSIIVRSGSTLHIEGNGRLTINDNCKVIIEKGASLVYDAGAIIQLLGNDAVLEIQGDLVLGNTAVFKFTYPNSTSGYVKFSDPDFAQAPYAQIRTISAGQTASIELRGANKNDKILEVAQDLLQVAIGNGITTFKVEYGLVDFTYNNGACYISSDANVRFYNSKFTKAPSMPPSTGQPSNVAVWGQAQCQITSCEFSPNVGLIGNLFAYGNKLTVTGTLAYGGIRTQGAGLTLNSVTTSSLTSELMSFNSIATNSKFIDGEGASIIASPVEFDFNSCRANNNYFSGYRVDGPTLLKVKCGQVKTNQYTGFHLANNASLSMNVRDNGGYVDARDNAVNTILLDNAHSIDIENGYNDLRPYDFYSVTSSQTSSSACVNFANCGYVVIEGSIQQMPANPVLSDNNRWQLSTNNTLFPLQATNGKDKYTRVSSTYSLPGSNDVRFVASSQSPIVACDYWNTSCTTCPKSYLEICPTCHVINTDDFTNVKTNEAVKSAITKLETASIDTTANKESVDMLYQVLQYPLPVANDGDKYVKSIAEKKILVALANGIEKSEIKVSEQRLSPEVMKVLEVVDSKILKAQADNNYDHLQNAVYEKALLYYSSKHRTDALSTLSQYLPSIQAKDLDRFNRLVCQITNEQQLLNGEISQYDYLRSMENCVPIQKREGTRRALTIPSEDLAEIETLVVQVYPNPAEDQINIQFLQVLLVDASFNIYDLAGKLVFSKQLKAGTEKSEITGFDLSNGMYIYKVSSEEEILQQGKLSIIK